MDDLYRRYLLAAACLSGEVRTIEGVTFDLRHAELGRNEWKPLTILDWPEIEVASPRLLFPWASSATREKFEKWGGAVMVRRGDTISVGSVQKVPIAADHGTLDHPQHREKRWAYLLVRRRSGAMVNVPQPWEFQGMADVMTPIQESDYKQARSAHLVRVSDALGLESIEDFLVGSPADWPPVRDTATPIERLAALAFLAAEEDHSQEAAMAFGYLMGRAEADALLLPHARRQIELRDQRRRVAKNPRKRGDKTRAAALGVIASSPEISRRKCAERVATIRGLTDVRGVERTIAEFFIQDEHGTYRPTPEAIAAAKKLRES